MEKNEFIGAIGIQGNLRKLNGTEENSRELICTHGTQG